MITPLGIGRGAGDPEISALAEVGTLEGHWSARAGCLSVVSPRTEATDGQTVVRLEDQSGNARHQNLQAGTPIYKSTDGPGGAPAVYFDGSSNLRHLTSATNHVIVAVGKWTGASSFPGANGLACTTGNAYGLYGIAGQTRLDMGLVDLSLDTVCTDGNWHVAWAIARVPYTVSGFLLGIRAAYWTGYLCEAAVYSTALTLKQIRQVVRFLAASWGLTLTE